MKNSRYSKEEEDEQIIGRSDRDLLDSTSGLLSEEGTYTQFRINLDSLDKVLLETDLPNQNFQRRR